MEIMICPVGIADKPVLRNLIELYQYESSEYDGKDVDAHGLFGYKYLDHYWTEAGRHAFFVKVADNYAGFVLVRDAVNTGGAHSIAEFFIMRKYRRKGVGRIAAHRIFGMFAGKWRVVQESENHLAQAFWRAVIAEYTNGRFDSLPGDEEWNGPILKFTSEGKDDE